MIAGAVTASWDWKEKLWPRGNLGTTPEDFAEFFQSMAAARVVMEVGTHSAWASDVVASCGHEALVANPRQMEGLKRRKRKNDRIDAHKLARAGRMDPSVSVHNKTPECGSTEGSGRGAGTRMLW